MIDLYAPPGIGDIYWVLMKLARTVNAAGEKLRIHTPPGSSAKNSRGKFLEYIDCVESVKPDGIPYADLVKRGQQYSELQPVMYCECNTWLESGQRLEHYMPNFPTEFILNWQVDLESIHRASKYLDFTKKNVFVYTSGITNNNSESTGKWTAGDWLPNMLQLRQLPDTHLVWLGAHYDADILDGKQPIRQFFDKVMIDEPADVVMSALRLCDGFISYQSGLSCISVVESIPTKMLYFKKIAALTNTFNPPEGNYSPVFFDDKPNLSDWVESLPPRQTQWRDKVKQDYTFWVNQNVDKTETDWLANQWIHEDQYNAIKSLKGPILEVGCGSGQLATYIKNQYTGIDQSDKLLALARKKSPEKTFILADVRDLVVAKHQNVCAFGFMKHFSLPEWDTIFSALASKAEKTLTIETPISADEWEDRRHDFPHTFVSPERVARNAKAHGFEISNTSANRSGEMIYTMER